MKKRDADEIAKILADFFKEDFYGKDNSKYRIKKAQIKALAGNASLTKEFMTEIKEELRKLGYVWVRLVDQYIVLEEGPLHRCRAVTKALIKELTGKKKNVDKDSSGNKKKRVKDN
jgi:uncharacterized membrane-anchored protein YjiN (DUF445 family)